MRYVFATVLAAAGLTLCAPALAATVLTITEHHHHETPAGMTRDPKVGQVEPTDSTNTLTLTLSKDVVQSDDGKHRLILDFGTRRMTEIDLAAKTYQEHSLYHLLGFNVLEFPNRLMIMHALTQARLKQVGGPAMVEQLFSFTDPDSHTKIDAKHQKDGTDFLVDKTLLVRASDALTPIPPEDLKSYWKWFRYLRGGHPQIDSALEQKSGVPTDLHVLRPNWSLDTIDMHIESAQSVPDAPYSIEGFARHVDDKGPGTILKGLGSDARAQQDAILDLARKDRDLLMGDGKVLEAFLANSVGMLSTGAQDTAWFSSHHDSISGSTDAMTLFKALGAKSKEEGKAAVSTIEELKSRTTSSYGYMLDIYLGDAKTVAGQDGRPDLLAALQVNPYVTGAWFDLGSKYFSSFHSAEAWDCWDFARSLQPEHPFRDGPDGIEKRLVTEHPEFY
jgi:hypothetical protein